MTPFSRLEAVLLERGGTEVEPACCSDHESLHPGLLKKGAFITTEGRRMVPGDKNKCHVNAGRLSMENPNWTMMSGYALAHDQWFIHSWLIDENEHIIETTCCTYGEEDCYVLYYGVKGAWRTD